jgi:probable F420-dependent oxidoreductase
MTWPFRFGINHVTLSREEWLETARKAEALGYDTLIAQDHFGSQLAPLPALVAAAAVTGRLRLATIVLDNDFRHPALVAKEAATVDVLSNGRMELGLGAGWLQSDYDKTGLPYYSPAERIERLGETVQICKALFSPQADCLTFSGKHYTVRNLEALPHPVQQPRLPIMIGGRQNRMLSLAAREADIVSISLLDQRGPGLPDPPPFSRKVEWVRQAAGARMKDVEIHVNASLVEVGDVADSAVAVEQQAVRRGMTPEQVLDSPATLIGSIDAIVERLLAYREQFGVTYYIIQGRSMDAFAPVVARLHVEANQA